MKGEVGRDHSTLNSFAQFDYVYYNCQESRQNKRKIKGTRCPFGGALSVIY